jgi:hypothetical protein
MITIDVHCCLKSTLVLSLDKSNRSLPPMMPKKNIRRMNKSPLYCADS